MFPNPISWLDMEKLNITQQKHTFTITRYALQHKINTGKKLGLVASYDIQLGNAVGLFWFQRLINLSLTYLDTYPLTYSLGPTQGA